MSVWLYPFSKDSGFKWTLKDGKRIPVSLDNYIELVRSKRLTEDKGWYIYFQYDRIQPGDRVYLYTGERDAGIVGYVTVIGKGKDRWGDKKIDIKFDLAKCRMLIKRPISAQIVRSWIPFPRHTVESLDDFKTELQKYLPWKVDSRTEYSDFGFKALKLKPRSKLRISPRDYERQFIHDTLLEPAAKFLEDNGFKPGTRNFEKLQVDLVGTRKKQVIIAEGKTNKKGTGREEARQAFGQLFEYRWLFKREIAEKLEYSLWVIFQKRPDRQVLEFLEDHDFLVSWIENKSVRFSDRSKNKFTGFAE